MAFGLPAVPNIDINAIGVGVLGQLEAKAWDFISLPLQWKILNYEDDGVAYEADNFIEMTVIASSDVVNVPISEGSFCSYNKVDRPFEIRATISVWGVPSTRLKFLSWLEKVKREAIKLKILTPETVYSPITLAGYTLSRNVNSGTVTSIVAECRFLEVREAPLAFLNEQDKTCDTSKAKNPEDMPSKPDKYQTPQEKAIEGIKSGFDNARAEAQKIANKALDIIKKAPSLVG